MIEYINYGGADGVSGACHMISSEYGNILLDCGLFQGKDKKIYSNAEFYFDPRDLDGVVLSHAHIDHCGRIPSLYHLGYRGKVYGTKATKLLCSILLDECYRTFNDLSGKNDKLFTLKDVKMFLDSYVEIDYRAPMDILENVNLELYDAGHLLGSSSILLKVNDTSIFYSGDIGKINTPILNDPDIPHGADYIIIESTYGNLKEHKSNIFKEEFRNIVVSTLTSGGRCVIPASTVGKMQEILYLLNEIFEEKKFKYKVYIDSPMSVKVIDIYRECRNLYDEEARYKLNSGDDPLIFDSLEYIYTKEDSINIQKLDKPYIVLAGGGNCENGRIVYHLRKQISCDKNSIILIGNQSQGTLGWKLCNNYNEVSIFNKIYDVNAKVYNFPSLSGHCDRKSLIKYIFSMIKYIKPKKMFLVHGKRDSQQYLREELRDVNVEYTRFKERYELA